MLKMCERIIRSYCVYLANIYISRYNEFTIALCVSPLVSGGGPLSD